MMVSRRKILSRSRDDLTNDDEPPTRQFSARFEEDVWYTKHKLFTDHVEEILKKWDSIDDEIWAKAIVMERNRRVAKAYARAPVLTINGGEGGFDGFRLGLNGFPNPMRDPKTEEFKEAIGLGAKVKMDENGNILIKRLSKSPVYVKNLEDGASTLDIHPVPNQEADPDIPLRVFDMRKFQQSINRELRRSNPDRGRLESQCVMAVCLVKEEAELLDSPVWVLIINIVALEMLKAKLPPSSRVPSYQGQNGEKRFLVSGSSDEDPYSLTSGHGSSGSSNPKEKGKQPGGLLGKEKEFYIPQNWSATQDRRRDRSRDNFLDETESATLKPRTNNRRRMFRKSEEKTKIVDDPYYCGFSARADYNDAARTRTTETSLPRTTARSKEVSRARDAISTPRLMSKTLEKAATRVAKYREAAGILTPSNQSQQPLPINQSHFQPANQSQFKPTSQSHFQPTSQSQPNLSQIPQVQPYWWQSRLYPDQSRVFGENRMFPEQNRRYTDHITGAGMKSGGYYNPRLPYSFGNEFSSLQMNRPSIPKVNPSTPATKPRKKFLDRRNIFKSSS